MKSKENNVKERRHFSESFRRARVKEYEEGKATVKQISRAYGVSGRSVYNWIEKYSIHYQKSIVKIVEPKSATQKVLRLEEQVSKLERLLGQKQVEIEYLAKLIDCAETHYQIDIKKNSNLMP